MKTEQQIRKEIEDLEQSYEDAQIQGHSKTIKTFSDLRKVATRINTLYWVLDNKQEKHEIYNVKRGGKK
jgi:hypothetical protein